jgi:hypothetical protein
MAETKTDQTSRNATTFAQWLVQHRKGEAHDALTDALRDVVVACGEVGKSGAVTLTVSVKPLQDEGMLEITARVDSKIPKPDPGSSLWFTDELGNVSRSDPRQTTIDTVTGEVVEG